MVQLLVHYFVASHDAIQAAAMLALVQFRPHNFLPRLARDPVTITFASSPTRHVLGENSLRHTKRRTSIEQPHGENIRTSRPGWRALSEEKETREHSSLSEQVRRVEDPRRNKMCFIA